MVSRGYSSIRAETAELNVSKDGFTAFFVDQSASNADDDNDGNSWTSPKLSIGGATTDAEEWCKIFIRPGVYTETVLINTQGLELIGVARDGTSRAEIAPLTGIPLTITKGMCKVKNISCISTDNHAILANVAPDTEFFNLYAEVNSSKYAIWLSDCDRASVEKCFLDGNAQESSIGILIGDDTVDAKILDNYITGFGTGGIDTSKAGYAVATHTNSQRCLIRNNIMINNYCGTFLYKNTTYRGTNVIFNQFFENSHYDVYDEADTPGESTSGNSIRNNLYGYQGWMADNNNDGLADLVVDCYGSYDLAPLAGTWLWECDHTSRVAQL